MKNRLFLFCLMAVMAVSCAKEQQEVIQTVTDDPVFHATIENADTRVFADEQLRVLWNADDRVSIFNKTTFNRQYRFNGEDGANAGSFTKVSSDDFVTSNPLSYVYSVYPYNENTSISNDGEIAVFLPSAQTYREDSFGLGANTMIAITEDDELMFKNLCGYFAIKLYGDNVSVSSITLKGNNNELLAGKATVVAQMDAAPTIQFDTANATKELTLTCPTPVTLGTTVETATTFWFVIPPTTFEEGFSIVVKNINNESFAKSSNSVLDIRRSTLKKTAALEVILEPNPEPIQFSDIALKAKLIAAFDTDGDGELSYSEAAAVTSAEEIETAFDGVKVFTSFDEFQFFTGITKISPFMFSFWEQLTSIILPTGVTEIGGAAFYSCSKMESINIPKGVIKIGSSAFGDCRSMKNLYLEDINSWLTCTIQSHPFEGWSQVEGERHLFVNGCEVTTITIPDDFTSIGKSSFEGCSGLTSVIIPESVISIGESSFEGCSGLTSVIIPESVKRIGQSAFCGCSALSVVTIPNAVSSIEYSTFSACTSLTTINLPSGLLSIGNNVFAGCSKLTGVIIPEEVRSIGERAFVNCTALSSITIPNKVVSIGEYALSGCRLSSITCYPETPPTGGSSMFGSYFFFNCPIFVPTLSVDAYKSAPYWSNYADRIQPLAPLPEAVDLGLSVKWASFNLGASKPEEHGDYYAWGETEPYYDSFDPLTWMEGKEPGYDWATYVFCNGSYNNLTKYNNDISYGLVDNKMSLNQDDDAAYRHWGGSWRMPTQSEFQELIDNCSLDRTTVNGIYGFRFTSNRDGFTHNSIFLPAAGYLYRNSISHESEEGLYWSSTLVADYSYCAFRMDCYSSGANSNNRGNRCVGQPIRPVYHR